MRLREMMLATDVKIRTDESIRRAIRLLRDSKLNGIPVVDAAGKLIGYFSRSNLFDCLLAGVSLDCTIAGHYVSRVVQLREDKSFDTVDEVAAWLRNSKVGQTIVVNAQQEPVGVATQAETVIHLLDRTDCLYKELSGVIENVPAGIVATDEKGMVTMANQYAKEILSKVRAGSFIGDHIRDLRADFAPVLAGSWTTPRKIEHNFLKLIATAVPIHHNAKSSVIFVIQDMTDVEGVAHELETVKELKMTLETVLEVAYEGVAVLDEYGLVTLANARFCDKVGEPRERVLGQEIAKFVPMTDTQVPLRVLEVKGKPCVISTLPITKQSSVKGYVVKIYEDLDQLADIMQQIDRINLQLDYYKDELYKVNGTSYTIGSIVGSDDRVEKLKAQVLQVARSNSTVLITGESGTGKELFAQSIHNASSRRKEPLIKVNCSAIPAELAEAELFGYDDGAFTGARKQGKPGKFELAEGGTIFLDEIGDMPLMLQSKLLRVIQEKEIERVGSVKSRRVDVRIIAATNKDLKRLVAEGRFREDLYFRINVVELKIPPLRERKSDIPVLVDSFIKKHNGTLSRKVTGITDAALAAMLRYNWPGNIRELENIVERMLNYVESGMIDLDDLPEDIGGVQELTTGREAQSLASLEQEAIQAALEKTRGNKSQAARILGISRSKLYEKLALRG